MLEEVPSLLGCTLPSSCCSMDKLKIHYSAKRIHSFAFKMKPLLAVEAEAVKLRFINVPGNLKELHNVC